jgi:hypothetical protein
MPAQLHSVHEGWAMEANRSLRERRIVQQYLRRRRLCVSLLSVVKAHTIYGFKLYYPLL